jgi:hypothetical protein
METRDTFVITFSTSLGRQKNIRINDPRPNISRDEAMQIGGRLGSSSLFDESVGQLQTIVGAAIVTERIETLIAAD